jgi:hypothetical protein
MNDDSMLRGFPGQPVVTDFERAFLRRYLYALLAAGGVWFMAGVGMTQAALVAQSFSLMVITLAIALALTAFLMAWTFRVPSRLMLIPVPVNSQNVVNDLQTIPPGEGPVIDSDVISLLDRRLFQPKPRQLP